MARLPTPHRLSGLPRNGIWILITGLLGLLSGAALQSRFGCSATTAAACVCERRLRVQLDAATVAAAHADSAQQQEGAAQDVQQQQPAQADQHEQQAASQAAAAAEAPAPGRFVPDGYELPEECAKHEPLYAGILDSLRPWFERGVTREDMDACLAAVPAGYDVAKGTPQTHHPNLLIAQQNSRFRLLTWENEVIVTSGGMERWGDHGQQGLHYFMIQQIQDAARRFGLPDIEFAVGFGDDNSFDGGENSGGRGGPPLTAFPPAMCPLMTFAKHPKYTNLLIPSGEFVKWAYDEWVARMLADPGPTWEQREQRAVGRWSLFRTTHPHTDRWGVADQEDRQHYVAHSNATGHKYTNFSDVGAGHLPLSEQRRFRYTFNTDGFTASTRLAKLLATGQTVIKQDSELIEFFYPALQQWVHYVPSGRNGIAEIDRVVQFLRDHDHLARRVAGNAQRFAATHLVTEGRLCYIKVLFEELAKLTRYRPRLEDFPTRISWDEDVQRFLLREESLRIQPEA
ncbi:hypothetical protein ABPG75_013940 [Micractinium tetrahymenae]